MILAIDNGKHSGYAYRTRTKPARWVCGEVNGREQSEMQATVWAAKVAGCTHMVVEDAFCGPNIKTYGDLREGAKAWEMVAASAGMVVIPRVMPRVWQSAILNVMGAACPPGKTKKWSVWVARSLGATPQSEHEADAVCIAEYAERARAQGVDDVIVPLVGAREKKTRRKAS